METFKVIYNGAWDNEYRFVIYVKDDTWFLKTLWTENATSVSSTATTNADEQAIVSRRWLTLFV